MSWLGLDIGGANLKVADGLGYAASRPFALWKQPERLAAELTALLELSPPAERIAITMTGELCDCFPDKATGVRHILDAAATAIGSRPTFVYLTDGRMVSVEQAAQELLLAAASNWHCLARFAGRYAPHGCALLIDIGSTTSDFIPLEDGIPVARGRTDTERIAASELAYRGVERTPCCAIVPRIKFRGQACHMAAELFATMRDVYLLLKKLPEAPDDCDTADGKPATVEFATRRLARLVCADTTECGAAECKSIARALDREMQDLLFDNVIEVAGALSAPPSVFILSGHGEFIARSLIKDWELPAKVISLTKILGPKVSRCAPAHALAVLARETFS